MILNSNFISHYLLLQKNKNMKVTVVGAGNVGATCADVLAQKEVCNEVVLVDIKEGLSEGKSLDIFKKLQLIFMILELLVLLMIMS